MTIAAGKIRILQVARRQLQLDDSTWQALLRETAGVSSSRELDELGFTAVMDRLEAAGFRSTSKRRPLPYRDGMASPAEVQLIRGLWAEFTAGEGTDLQLGRWLERQFKVSSVRFLTAGAAPKAIAALKAAITKRTAARAKSAITEDCPPSAA